MALQRFDDIHIRARLAFPADGGGRAGVFCGSLICCLNYDTCRWSFITAPHFGSYATSFSKTSNADLAQTRICTPLRCVFVETRSVFIPAIHILALYATVSGLAAVTQAPFRRHGLRTTPSGRRLDLRAYERFDVTFPDGSVVEYVELSVQQCWDEEFQIPDQ